MRFVLPVIAAVIIAVFSCGYLYSNTVLRYIICGIGITGIVAVMMVTKDKWLGILRKRKEKKRS